MGSIVPFSLLTHKPNEEGKVTLSAEKFCSGLPPPNFVISQKGYRELASALEFNQPACGGIATREAKLKQDPAQVKAVIRATFEAMDFSRKERAWMVDYIQNKWKLTPKVAEESYRTWLNGFTSDGKIPLKDLQEIYDTALASQLIPTAVPVPKVMDYTLLDEVLKERKQFRGQ